MISLGSIRRRLRKVLDKLIEIVSRITRRVECFFCIDWSHTIDSFTLVERRTEVSRDTAGSLENWLLVS